MKSLFFVFTLLWTFGLMNNINAQDVRNKGNVTLQKKEPVKKKTNVSNSNKPSAWLKVRIINKDTGVPLPDVTVDIVNLNKGMGLKRKITDKQGRFLLYPIKGVKKSELTLVIQNYGNMPPLLVTLTDADKEVTIYKIGNGWSWSKK